MRPYPAVCILPGLDRQSGTHTRHDTCIGTSWAPKTGCFLRLWPGPGDGRGTLGEASYASCHVSQRAPSTCGVGRGAALNYNSILACLISTQLCGQFSTQVSKGPADHCVFISGTELARWEQCTSPHTYCWPPFRLARQRRLRNHATCSSRSRSGPAIRRSSAMRAALAADD